MIKKQVVLVPSAFNGKVLGDILPFGQYYKDDFDVYIISNLYDEQIIKVDGINYVKNKTSYANYLVYTADYIIDAGTLNCKTRVSSFQKRISVWHGIPYKKMFIDLDSKYALSAYSYSYNYDLMISPSKFYSEKFLRAAMLYRGEILETALPRTDKLLATTADEIVLLKKSLKLPLDKKIVLYAPTLREEESFSLPFNAKKLNNILGPEYILITKMHYMNSLQNHGDFIDFTNYLEVNDLLLVCDLLITDYSSLMFDYALLNKTLVLYQYDIKAYEARRGLMFDINKYLDPKYVVDNNHDFEALIKELVSKPELPCNTKMLINNFYEYASPTGTKALVDKLAFDSTRRTKQEVIFLINDLHQIGGIHTFVLNLAREFKRKYNMKTMVIAINEFSMNSDAFYEFDTDNEIDFKLSKEHYGGAVNDILKNTQGFIISCQFSAHKVFQDLFIGKNVVAMFHGDIKDVVNRGYYHWHLDAIEHQTIANYKRLLTLSIDNSNLLKAHLSNNKVIEKISYMNNSLDFSDSKKLFAKSNDFVVISRLDNDKNIFDLIKIMKHPKINPELRLFVYGNGKLKAQFEVEINNNNLEDKILVMGYCNNQAEMFSNKQGLVLTSLTEGFPLSILEAIGYYVPVYIYDSFTTAKELVKNVGIAVEAKNIDAMVDALNNPLEVSDEVFTMKIADYDNQGCIKRWGQLFNEISLETDYIKYNKFNIKNLLRSDGRRLFSRAKQFLIKVRRVLRRLVPNNTRRALINIYRMFQYYWLKLFNGLEKQPLVSIIVPYYYSSKTIKTTLKSINKLKYLNYEVLIINDGSDEYVPPKMNNLTYHVLDKNVGLSAVRNYGLDHANGEYVFFLDSDDTINKYGLSFLVDYAKKYDLEVVSGICRRFNLGEKHSHIWYKGIYNKTYINTKDKRYLLLNDTLSTNKLYKLEMLKRESLYFVDGYYEDKLFSDTVYKKVERIGIIKKDVYLWHVYGDNTSITSSFDLNNFRHRIDKIDKVLDTSNNLYRKKYLEMLINHDYRIYINNFDAFNSDDKVTLFNEMRDFLCKWKEYLYLPHIIRIDNIEYTNALLENDYKRFEKIANFVTSIMKKDKG